MLLETLKREWDSVGRDEKAETIRNLIQDAGFTRNSLAKALGVHHSVVDRLCTFNMPAAGSPAASILDAAEDLHAPCESTPPEDVPDSHDDVKQSTTIKGNFLDIDVRSYRVKNVDELIAYCEVNLQDWELVEGTINKWEGFAAQKSKSVYLTGKKGNEYIGYETGKTDIVVVPLFQVKARFKKKVAIVHARRQLDEMKAEWKREAPVYAPIILPSRRSGILLEVDIADHHMGKLAWAPETRHDYDIKIAERLFDEAVESAIERSRGYGIDRIVFPVGNDLLHFDNLENMTTHGTVVSADTRFQKVYRTTRIMVTRAIERFRTVAPVDVVMVPGNHDTLATFTLGDALDVQFTNCPDVHIDNTPRTRKYYQWGKCMVMWAHGNKGKLENYPLLMATEEPKMWGDTVYREAHTHDKHQRKMIELHGVAVRIMPTLCAPDDWHVENLFVGNIRSSENILWSLEQGVIGTSVYNLPPKEQLGIDIPA